MEGASRSRDPIRGPCRQRGAPLERGPHQWRGATAGEGTPAAEGSPPERGPHQQRGAPPGEVTLSAEGSPIWKGDRVTGGEPPREGTLSAEGSPPAEATPSAEGSHSLRGDPISRGKPTGVTRGEARLGILGVGSWVKGKIFSASKLPSAWKCPAGSGGWWTQQGGRSGVFDSGCSPLQSSQSLEDSKNERMAKPGPPLGTAQPWNRREVVLTSGAGWRERLGVDDGLALM